MAKPKAIVRNHLRALRLAAGEMTQQELADRVGVSRQTINAIEGGRYSPSLEVALLVARVLGKRVDDVWSCDGGAPAG